MATATMFPDLAFRFAEAMANIFETGRVEDLTPEEVSTAIRMGTFLKDLFAQARKSIEGALSHGVDAKEFAAKYERSVTDLETILTTTHRVVTKAQASRLPSPTEQFVPIYQALMDEMLSLHQFLAEAVAKAKLPVRPVDWKCVQAAEVAYAKGETKPFQRSPKS